MQDRRRGFVVEEKAKRSNDPKKIDARYRAQRLLDERRAAAERLLSPSARNKLIKPNR